MKKQTITWTALPKPLAGQLAEGTQLRLAAFVSPRLWNSDENVLLMKLSEFPDFLDWPAVIGQASFQVEFNGGPALPATVENVSLRSDLWQGLFKNSTDVIPFQFEDLRGATILTFPAGTLHDSIRGIYQRAAIDPAYGSGLDLPSIDVLGNDPDLSDIARPTRPRQPYDPVHLDDAPVIVGGEEPGEGPGDGGDGDEEPGGCSGCSGCLGCLSWPFRLLEQIFKWLGMGNLLPAVLQTASKPAAASAGSAAAQEVQADPPLRPAWPQGIRGGAGPSAQAQAYSDLHTYLEPHSMNSVALPSQSDLEAIYDFHKMIASLGDYPKLLAYMGLVVDLVVTLPANLPAANGTVRVVPTLNLQTATTHHSPWTSYALADDRFQARPRTSDPEISNGLLRLHDTNQFRVIQLDVAGGGTKVQNTATNMRAMVQHDLKPANVEEDAGLPALRTGGISLIRPERSDEIRYRFDVSYALNAYLANLDQSPLPAASGPQPPPAPSDVLFAEDITRGYRIDVLDQALGQWRSLCQRVGTYTFLETAGGVETLNNEVDEGFVQLGITEALTEEQAGTLKASEALITWEGWSLSAPRPGRSILPDHTTGEPDTSAKTQFKLETSFQVVNKSLPRLRFGHSYRLRARAVDLAGNSLFSPADPDFQQTQPEVSPEHVYRRFEPVSPPPLLLRADPIEGESLEHLVVRSQYDDPPASIESQTTERHLVPPKTSQLMAEQHSLLDGPLTMLRDLAGYELASREAGSMTHSYDLATDTHIPLPGAVEKQTPERTYWIQQNASFDLAYLPDPYARGLLLLGLPGMAAFDQIIEPDGQVVNKIPFEGAWPDYQPVRIRLQGRPDQAPPLQPSWDAGARMLTVFLPQGDVANVRISCYFHEADLDKMAIWGWIEQAGPGNLQVLRGQTASGRSWLHLPYRSLQLVHAVQQPLRIPDIDQLTIAPDKALGATKVTLEGELDISAKSTGKVDIWANWSDPIDDLAKPGFDPLVDRKAHDMHVAEVRIDDPQADKFVLTPARAVQHVRGDTKFHKVTYRPVATTRFREYMQPATLADPSNLIRPTPAEQGTPAAADAEFEMGIPNSARPAAPDPVSVLPTFSWSESDDGTVLTRERRGGGLRIYLNRPWFSSGEGELLGLTLRPPGIAPESDQALTLRKYTSEWGMDPIWSAMPTRPLDLGDFINPADSRPDCTLAELPDSRVHVAGFEPYYDDRRNLWACDILMNAENLYFPFVRLALARFHPVSVPDAFISRVVRADFSQVVPHRKIEYDRSDLAANGVLHIRANGPSYFSPDTQQFGSTIMVARLERRQFPGQADELAWQSFGFEVLNPVQQDPANTVWEGRVILPQPLTEEIRVVLLELEMFQSDRPQEDFLQLIQRDEGPRDVRVSQALADQPAGTALLDQRPPAYRIVFADATNYS